MCGLQHMQCCFHAVRDSWILRPGIGLGRIASIAFAWVAEFTNNNLAIYLHCMPLYVHSMQVCTL